VFGLLDKAIWLLLNSTCLRQAGTILERSFSHDAGNHWQSSQSLLGSNLCCSSTPPGINLGFNGNEVSRLVAPRWTL